MSYVIHRFGLLHHPYADDTQLYVTIKKQECFADKLFNMFAEQNVQVGSTKVNISLKIIQS